MVKLLHFLVGKLNETEINVRAKTKSCKRLVYIEKSEGLTNFF